MVVYLDRPFRESFCVVPCGAASVMQGWGLHSASSMVWGCSFGSSNGLPPFVAVECSCGFLLDERSRQIDCLVYLLVSWRWGGSYLISSSSLARIGRSPTFREPGAMLSSTDGCSSRRKAVSMVGGCSRVDWIALTVSGNRVSRAVTTVFHVD